MNYREPPHLPVGARRALRCLSLLLLPVMAPEAAPALPRPRHATWPGDSGPASESLPYLTVMGAPPLRFQKTPPPPDVSVRPAAAAPPIPSLSSPEAFVAQANAAAARSASAQAREDDVAPVTEVKSDIKEAPVPVKAGPPPILPDDTRPSVKPEDFLPFFQLPGASRSAGEPTVIVPAAISVAPAGAPLPPSSATYTQSPK
jgi:hypothetical protein